MKKMISLCFIACASLTSSTTFGMFIQRLHNHTKRFTMPQRKYNSSADTILMQIMTKIDRQNSLLNQEIATTKVINEKLDTLIKNQSITKNNQPEHRLIEMEDLPYESKYHRELDAYHAQKRQ